MARAFIPLLALLAPLPAVADEFVPFPGGIADKDGRTAYVQAVKGGIDALDLATGKVLWGTPDFARPVALTKGLLVVQVPEKGKAHVVRLAVLDPAKMGAQLRVSDPIAFPDWVSVHVTHGRSFRSAATVDDRGQVLLGWEARGWYAGGANPTEEIEKAARKEGAGTAVVDVATGKVKMTDAAPGKEKPPAKVALKLEPGAQDVTPLKDRVYYRVDGQRAQKGPMFETTRTLKAVDATGNPLWQHPLWAPPMLLPPP